MSVLGHTEMEEGPQSTGRWQVRMRERTLGEWREERKQEIQAPGLGEETFIKARWKAAGRWRDAAVWKERSE